MQHNNNNKPNQHVPSALLKHYLLLLQHRSQPQTQTQTQTQAQTQPPNKSKSKPSTKSTASTTSEVKYGPLSQPAKYPMMDVSCNLLDTMFAGEYHLKKKHAPDLHLVLERAFGECFGVCEYASVCCCSTQAQHPRSNGCLPNIPQSKV